MPEAIAESDLVPGARFTAPDGMTITPVETIVEVLWVDRDRDVIYYHKHGTHAGDLRQTTIGRFLSIVRARA